MNKKLLLCLNLFLFLFCAKKMLPPSPDRFPPHLIEVNPRSRVQIELVFDEAIDPSRFVPESVEVVGLKIKGISLGRDRSRVLIWTEPQKQERYSVKGMVFDQSGNIGRFRAGFQGSVRIDTIAPRIATVLPAPGTTGLFKNIKVVIRFSEPVDTAFPLNYLLVPRGYETLFQRSWNPNWQEVRFVCRDSIGGQEFYFLLQPGAQDLEGNRCLTPGWTYWSADTVFQGIRVRGRAIKDGNPLRTGIVFFNQEHTLALAPILTDGSFELKLRPDDYLVFGVSDTDFDGLVDLATETVRFNTLQESLNLLFVPESLPRLIDEYCR
ncbi:MAG: Ig-like domain-containing protein [candidate division WOR-3 bacterium]